MTAWPTVLDDRPVTLASADRVTPRELRMVANTSSRVRSLGERRSGAGDETITDAPLRVMRQDVNTFHPIIGRKIVMNLSSLIVDRSKM
jgi:hypothetical protein